jgi:multiple sugar transport system substrate-binding protein
MDSVLADLDTGLQNLGGTDPKALLQRFQKNAQTAIGG